MSTTVDEHHDGPQVVCGAGGQAEWAQASGALDVSVDGIRGADAHSRSSLTNNWYAYGKKIARESMRDCVAACSARGARLFVIEPVVSEHTEWMARRIFEAG